MINVVGKGSWKAKEVGKLKVRKFEMKLETIILKSSCRRWKMTVEVGKFSINFERIIEVGKLILMLERSIENGKFN